MAIALTVGDTKTITAKFRDGPPDVNGKATGNVVPTPATVVWSSSAPAIMSVTSVSALSANLKVLGNGQVTITAVISAASDATANYSGFTGNTQFTLNNVTVTILSWEFVIA